MINHIPFAISCIIIGIILFQCIFIAPSINKLINKLEASKFLRYIWPNFFLILSILSILSIFQIDNEQEIPLYFFIICCSLMLLCYFITPIINKAKDSSKKRLWMLLHFFTVILTIITLILNIGIVISWKFIL